jgi:hypothetical protein
MGGKIFWEFLRQNFAKGFGLGRFVFKVVAIVLNAPQLSK